MSHPHTTHCIHPPTHHTLYSHPYTKHSIHPPTHTHSIHTPTPNTLSTHPHTKHSVHPPTHRLQTHSCVYIFQQCVAYTHLTTLGIEQCYPTHIPPNTFLCVYCHGKELCPILVRRCTNLKRYFNQR